MIEAERAIREALPFATPGRWEHVFANGGREHYVYAPDAHYRRDLPGPVKVAWLPYSPGSNRDANDAVYIAACNPENIAALLAEIDRLRQWEVTGREWIDKTDWMQSGPTPVRWLGKHRADALRDEINLLRAAIDTQPSPPTREDMDWAGKVHLAEAEKENDALRAEVEALAKAFLELHATVVGECPSLLNEDSGGSAALIALVMDALAQIEQERSDG